jgi:hypothetical protein
MEVSSYVDSIDTISARLERRFGLGSRPELRRALYRRLEELCNDESIGERVYRVVAEVAADAAGKTKPGNYFSYVVCERLKERSLIARPEPVF